MSYETKTYRNLRNTWQAETIVPVPDLGPLMVLQILTMKRWSGAVATTARIAKQSKENGWCVFEYDDFDETLLRSKARASAKAIGTQHAAALENVDQVIARALTYYKTQSAA